MHLLSDRILISGLTWKEREKEGDLSGEREVLWETGDMWTREMEGEGEMKGTGDRRRRQEEGGGRRETWRRGL